MAQPQASKTQPKLTAEEQEKRQKAAPRSNINAADGIFRQEALDAHNKYRAKHGAPALVMDDDLVKVAQAYVEKLAKSGENFSYSANGYGESVYFTTEGPVSGSIPVNAWYTESRRFKWDNIDKQKGTSHFTQIIWKNTKKMGIAMATSKIGIWIVANYYPPGNVVGKYKENISKGR